MFGFMKNDSAVSPIVATLVLIVVAIIGAAAVGVLMGTFSSDVSEKANAGDISDSASSNVLIAGSTTVQPVSELLAKAYMKEHQGIKITVQGGGSGAGVSSVGMDIVDIGSASRPVKTEELQKYPNLQTFQIGGSAVMVVTNDLTGTSVTGATKDGLKELYTAAEDIDMDGKLGWTDSDTDKIIDAGEIGDDSSGTVITIYQRSDVSGTEETLSKEYLGDESLISNSYAKGVSGNPAMVTAVDADTGVAIGFVDFGFLDDTKIKSLTLDTYTTVPDTTAILNTLAGKADKWPSKLCRPLNYITNGQPSSVEKDFINFAKSPAAVEYFEECGMFGITQFA
jgi:phosphate transport system substrate-binding protein